ncbi:MAG: COQ9 family protein [Rhodospirillales bacterium]
MRANQHEGPMDEGTQALREQLLEGMLQNAPFDGWSTHALRAAAKGLGLPAVTVKQAFPGGVVEAAELWSELADARMLDALGAQDLGAMRVRDRIAAGVRARIAAIAPHKEAARRFSSFMALPVNAPMAARLAWATCSHIWRAAGDTSADHNHYTKRGLLAPVYVSTVLYWLTDDGEETDTGETDWPETWAYLDRRIDDVIRVFGRLGRTGVRVRSLMPTPLAQVFAPRAPAPSAGKGG